MVYIRQGGFFLFEENPFAKNARGIAFSNRWSIVNQEIFTDEAIG